MNSTLYKGVNKLRKAFSLKANKAETGIGTLIVFIAMVLVAAVAATVLIHTAGNLQQRAQSTGSQTTQQVSSGIIVQSIFGLDNNATNPEAGQVKWISIYVTLGTGSTPINIGNATLSLTYQGKSASLTYIGASVKYNGTGATNNPVFYGFHSATSGTDNIFNSTYYSALNATGTPKYNAAAKANATNNESSHFAILAIQDPAKSLTGNYPVLSAGSQVALLVNVSAVFGGGGFAQGQSVSGSVVPITGSPGVIEFTAPVAFTQRVIQLQ